MPRNVAINSLATWMIEHPCIQETNHERNAVTNANSVSAERVIIIINWINWNLF